jgi:glycosyltransferase involved in cell wall biosynthesis
MKIALLAPPWLPVPPTGYGGIEAVVAALARELARRGHQVFLVASGDSRVEGVELIAPFPTSLRAQWGDFHLEMIHVLEGFAEVEADIYHDHSLMGALAWGGVKRPLVHTMHGPGTGTMGRLYRALSRKVPLIAISHQQAEDVGVGILGVVHNCVDIDRFVPSPKKGDYVAFLGRICHDKGPDDAIVAARKAGVRIVLAGKIQEEQEHEFFSQSVKPLLGPDAEYLGEIPESEKPEFLAHARALLVPLRWKEPFGLVMAEALACGTPVIAYPMGAAPEIVEDAKTGFLVEDVEGMASAIGRIDAIEPATCRQSAVERFSPQKMTEEVEAIYERLLEQRG